MARTVNWVPWVLITVLTQQYPYGAFPAWDTVIIWSNTSDCPVQLKGHETQVQKRSFPKNKKNKIKFLHPVGTAAEEAGRCFVSDLTARVSP